MDSFFQLLYLISVASILNTYFHTGVGTSNIPYILESNPHPNLIRTTFCPFLKRKKKVSSRF